MTTAIYHYRAWTEKDGVALEAIEEEIVVTEPRDDHKTPDRAAEISAWQRAIRTLADWKPGTTIHLEHVTRGRLPNTVANDDTSANESPIDAEILSLEERYLKDDRDLYLDCLNDKPLKDRHTAQEVRDGLILFHHVYLTCR